MHAKEVSDLHFSLIALGVGLLVSLEIWRGWKMEEKGVFEKVSSDHDILR